MTSYEPSAADLNTARMMLGLTYPEFSNRLRRPPEVIRNAIGAGRYRRASAEVLADVTRYFEGAGVIFAGPDIVKHRDRRLAPTRKAVGVMKGRRLRRARNALGYFPEEVASAAHTLGHKIISVETVVRFEKMDRLPLNIPVFLIVGALQKMGYKFAPNHGDRANVERRKTRLAAWEQDLPLFFAGVWILGPDLDLDL